MEKNETEGEGRFEANRNNFFSDEGEKELADLYGNIEPVEEPTFERRNSEEGCHCCHNSSFLGKWQNLFLYECHLDPPALIERREKGVQFVFRIVPSFTCCAQFEKREIINGKKYQFKSLGFFLLPWRFFHWLQEEAQKRSASRS